MPASARQPYLTAAVEGVTDEAIVRRLAAATGFALGPVHGGRGKQQLDRNLRSYGFAARHSPWLVLRDLDHDAECAPTLRAMLLPDDTSPDLLLRIPVRTVESWLLADTRAIAKFLGVSPQSVPAAPESLDRPKRTLVDLARSSRRQAIVHDLVPEEGVSAEVGPGYTARLMEFTAEAWSPENAAGRSPSLARCLAALRRLHDRLTARNTRT